MQRKIGKEIREIQQLLHQKMEQFKAQTGIELTYIQSRVIKYVSSQQITFQKDIEKEFKIRRSTATQILQVLERDGFIERESVDQDARLKKIILTEKSAQLQGQIESNINAMEKLLRKDISEENLTAFFAVIDQIKKNIE